MNKQPEALRSLYEITGNVADVNTVLVNRAELRRLHAENLRLTREPQQEPLAWIENLGGALSYNPHHEAARKLPEGVRFDLYHHQQNLNCESNQARLATLLGYVKADQKQVEQKPSPTAGMNIAQRILHVGGRNNAAGYVEFGSIQAVEALVRQVLRDLPQRAPLTISQLFDAVRPIWKGGDCTLEEIIRAVERAHDIK